MVTHGTDVPITLLFESEAFLVNTGAQQSFAYLDICVVLSCKIEVK